MRCTALQTLSSTETVAPATPSGGGGLSTKDAAPAVQPAECYDYSTWHCMLATGAASGPRHPGVIENKHSVYVESTNRLRGGGAANPSGG
jgi:hypothetical protein